MLRLIFISYMNLISSQFAIWLHNCIHYQIEWKIVWILISWVLKKPADLDPHCFQKGIYPGLTHNALRMTAADDQLDL